MAIVQHVADAQEQNYFGWSHPISDIPPDKSAAVLVEGIGGAAVDAVKAYAEVKTETIKDDIRNDVYPARDKEVNTLLDIRDGLRKKGLTTGDVEDVGPQAANYNPEDRPGVPTDISYGAQNTQTPPGKNVPVNASAAYAQAGPDEVPPEEVSGLPAELDARKASLDQNKISRTQFMMEMMKKAQRMRSENPRFADVIDGEFSRILGTDPANATMGSAIRDINAMVAQTQRQDPVMQDLRWANKQGFPNADVYMKGYKDGRYSADDVNEFINKGSVQFYRDRQRAAEDRGRDSDIKDRKNSATDRLRAQGGYVANNYFSAMRSEAGIATPEEMLDMVTRIQNGTLKADSEELVTLGGAIRAAKTNAYNELIKYSRLQPAGGGRTIEMDMGPEEVKKEALASLDLFDQAEKLITDKQVGAAFMAHNLAEAIGDQAHLNLLRDPNMGKPAREIASIRKTVGDNYLAQIATRHLTGGTQFTTDMNAWITRNELSALAPRDLRTQSGLDSLKTAVDRTKKEQINNPKVYDSLLGITQRITDPGLTGPEGDKLKVNAAEWAFDPVKNKGLFARFSKDAVNNDGSLTPGAFAAFQKVTSPALVQEINRLDATPQGKGIKNKYINFVQTTAGTDLLRSELNTMDSYFNDPNLQIAFNRGSGQFSVNYVPRSRGSAVDALRINNKTVDILNASPDEIRNLPSIIRPLVDAARDSFTRINMGTASLKSVAENSGMDPSHFILQTIAATRQGGDVPPKLRDQIEKSIINSTGIPAKQDKLNNSKPNPSGGTTKTESYRKPE